MAVKSITPEDNSLAGPYSYTVNAEWGILRATLDDFIQRGALTSNQHASPSGTQAKTRTRRKDTAPPKRKTPPENTTPYQPAHTDIVYENDTYTVMIAGGAVFRSRHYREARAMADQLALAGTGLNHAPWANAEAAHNTPVGLRMVEWRGTSTHQFDPPVLAEIVGALYDASNNTVLVNTKYGCQHIFRYSHYLFPSFKLLAERLEDNPTMFAQSTR